MYQYGDPLSFHCTKFNLVVYHYSYLDLAAHSRIRHEMSMGLLPDDVPPHIWPQDNLMHSLTDVRVGISFCLSEGH